MTKVMYGCCVGDWARFGANVAPRTDGRQVVALSGQPSIAAAYNSIMNAATYAEADVLILLHDDLELTDPDAEAKICAAVESGSDLVGIAGGGSDNGIMWWAQNPIGHTRSDDRPDGISFGAHSGDVQCLEGCLLAMPSWVFWNLRFDDTFPGWHGYDADMSRQIHAGAGRISVIDIDTWHHTSLGFKTKASENDWHVADALFREKWLTGPRY